MGGKAFEGTTKRILRENIEPTLCWLVDNWSGSKIQGGNYMDHLLGSAGKNSDSGDIDLNMRIELYNQEEVAKELIKILGEDKVKPRPGNNQIFTAVPIRGNHEAGYVQVDFMFGDYDWQQFSYFSAAHDPLTPPNRYHWRANSNASAFKGLFRTELIKALVAYNSDWVLEEDGEMVARVGPTFFHDRGCVWRYRHRPMRKDGTGRIKELKELTEDEFMAIYPSATRARTDVVNSPTKLVHMILDEHYQIDNLATLETVVSSLYYTYTAPAQRVIYQIYLERLNNLKVEIPTQQFRDLGIRV